MVRICLFRLRRRLAVHTVHRGNRRLCCLQQMRPPQKAGASGIDLMEVCVANRPSCNEDNIPAGFNCIETQPHSLAQASLDAIALYCVADPIADGKRKSAVWQPILQYADDELSVAGRISPAPDFLDARILADAVPFLHRPPERLLSSSDYVARRNQSICSRHAWPIDAGARQFRTAALQRPRSPLLDGLARCELHGQALPSTDAAALEDIAPTR
jgi:hypothetical protein